MTNIPIMDQNMRKDHWKVHIRVDIPQEKSPHMEAIEGSDPGPPPLTGLTDLDPLARGDIPLGLDGTLQGVNTDPTPRDLGIALHPLNHAIPTNLSLNASQNFLQGQSPAENLLSVALVEAKRDPPSVDLAPHLKRADARLLDTKVEQTIMKKSVILRIIWN